ncbi:MAG: biotin/lipoyl-containing protein [Phascolarctobacterium sp.]|nr:biotin/lipoyl-containing protein [Phascolarctobacterium sp.]
MKQYTITVNGTAYDVCVEEAGSVASAPKAAPAPAPAAAAPVAAGAATVTAPMPGKVLSVNVKAGDAVKAGDVLLILEAMKMQNEIMAPQDGTIAEVRVSANQNVATGDVMIVM